MRKSFSGLFDQLHDDFMSKFVHCVANSSANPTVPRVEINDLAFRLIAANCLHVQANAVEAQSKPADCVEGLSQLFQGAEFLKFDGWLND